jgi:hypothetical protein
MDSLQTLSPKVRIAVLGGFLLLPFLGLAIWHWTSKTSGTEPLDSDDQLTRAVEKYRFSAVSPPSRLFGPGTFTTVERLSNGTLALRPACIMDPGDLAAMWSKSPTIDESLFSAVKQTFVSSAKALGFIESNVTGKRINGFDFSLQNISVVALSDEGLKIVSRKYLKGDCESVILDNLRAGAQVCQSEEVLEADVAYKTNVQDGFGGGGKIGIPGQASGSGDADRQAGERYQVRGDALFLGAKVGPHHCLTLNNGRITQNGQTLAGSL